MYGGSCINIACVPTKDLIDSASKRDGRDPASYFTSAVADRDTLIATLNRTNHAMLEGKVLLLDGVASFTGPHTVKVVAGDDEITVQSGDDHRQHRISPSQPSGSRSRWPASP